MRTKEPRAQVKRRTFSALSARRCRFLQMNPWRIFLFLGVLCLFGAYGIVSLAERRTNGEVDRKFLDEIVHRQRQDADTLSVPERNKGTAGEIALGHPAVLRAELVVNSAIVRRAELVVRSGIGKRSRTSITTSRQNSQSAAESGRRLN
jgi:hypothetical protein